VLDQHEQTIKPRVAPGGTSDTATIASKDVFVPSTT
jgi:hypothetical protein